MKKILTTLLLVFASIFLFLNNTLAYEYLNSATISKLDSKIDKIPDEKKIQALDSIIKLVSKKIIKEKNSTKKAIYTELKSYLIEKKSSVGNTEDEILNLFEQYKSCDNGYSYINGSCVKDIVKCSIGYSNINGNCVSTNNNNPVNNSSTITNNNSSVNNSTTINNNSNPVNNNNTNVNNNSSVPSVSKFKGLTINGDFYKVNFIKGSTYKGFTSYNITPEYTKKHIDANTNFIGEFFLFGEGEYNRINENVSYKITNNTVLIKDILSKIDNSKNENGIFNYNNGTKSFYFIGGKTQEDTNYLVRKNFKVDISDPFLTNNKIKKSDIIDTKKTYQLIINEDKSEMMITEFISKIDNYAEFSDTTDNYYPSIFLGLKKDINSNYTIDYKKGTYVDKVFCKTDNINFSFKKNCYTPLFTEKLSTAESFNRIPSTYEYVNGFTNYKITPEYTKNGTNGNNFIEQGYNQLKNKFGVSYAGNLEYIIINNSPDNKSDIYRFEHTINYIYNSYKYKSTIRYLDLSQKSYVDITKKYGQFNYDYGYIPDGNVLNLSESDLFVYNGLVNKNNLIDNYFSYQVSINEDRTSMIVVKIPGKVANYNDFINGR